MSKVAYVGKESSRQRRQPVQRPCGNRMHGMFKALKKAGVAEADFEGCRGLRHGVREAGPGCTGSDHIQLYQTF